MLVSLELVVAVSSFSNLLSGTCRDEHDEAATELAVPSKWRSKLIGEVSVESLEWLLGDSPARHRQGRTLVLPGSCAPSNLPDGWLHTAVETRLGDEDAGAAKGAHPRKQAIYCRGSSDEVLGGKRGTPLPPVAGAECEGPLSRFLGPSVSLICWKSSRSSV